MAALKLEFFQLNPEMGRMAMTQVGLRTYPYMANSPIPRWLSRSFWVQMVKEKLRFFIILRYLSFNAIFGMKIKNQALVFQTVKGSTR